MVNIIGSSVQLHVFSIDMKSLNYPLCVKWHTVYTGTCEAMANIIMYSSSKSFAMLASSAKLWEEGKLDLDAPIQKYVASFPEKTFSGSPVTLTTRHLLSHLGGIRHYKKHLPSNEENKTKVKDKVSLMECSLEMWTFIVHLLCKH